VTAPHPEEEEASLMIELARGDDLALNSLMGRWSARIFAYLERCCGDAATADDLTQETFIRVYKHRLSYEPTRRFSTWLYTIATNLVRNHARWQQRHPVTLLAHETLQHCAPASESPSPVEALLREERAQAVRQAIQNLPLELREPLLLSTYEHLPHAQISGILELSEKAVEMRLYRARQVLRESLKDLRPDLPSPPRAATSATGGVPETAGHSRIAADLPGLA